MLLVVAAALIDSRGRVLLAKRPEGKSLEGLWEFPGGKVCHPLLHLLTLKDGDRQRYLSIFK